MGARLAGLAFVAVVVVVGSVGPVLAESLVEPARIGCIANESPVVEEIQRVTAAAKEGRASVLSRDAACV